MQLVPEAADRAKIAATTLQRPEQVRFVVCADLPHLPVSRYDLRGEQVVDR